jgi:hypothetical protein
LERDQTFNTQDKKEFTLYEELINHLKNTNESLYSPVIQDLRETFSIHKELISKMNNPSSKIGYDKLPKECHNAIRSLSNAIASYVSRVNQGLEFWDNQGIEFWKNFWYYPDSLSNFLKVYQSQPQLVEHDYILYLFVSYQNAFNDILRFLSDQVEKSKIFVIPVIGLKVDEIKSFDSIRMDYSQGKYTEAAYKLSNLMENKLRDFIYTVFVLQYNDRSTRLQHIPFGYHQYIKENSLKDKQHGFAECKNEMAYLNRHQYRYVLLGPSQPGNSNWHHVFSKIFVGWDFIRMERFLENFFNINLVASHNKKEVLTAIHQSDIHQYILDSIQLLILINKSYYLFFQQIQKNRIPGTSEIAYYFSLDNFKDNHRLRPISISMDNQERIEQSLKSSRINVIDLSDYNGIEQRYGIRYREVFAILCNLLKGSFYEQNIKRIKWKDPIVIIEMK